MAKNKKVSEYSDKELQDSKSHYESYYSGVVAPKEARDKYEAVDSERKARKRKNESAASGKTRLTTDDKRL